MVTLPKTGLLVGDRWDHSLTGGVFAHVNPADGQIQGDVPLAGRVDVDRAVQAARDAFPGWRTMVPAVRRDILLRWTALVVEHFDELMALNIAESGRPVSLGTAVPEWMAYYTGWADKIDGDLVAGGASPGMNYVVPEPYGVVGVIVPFNGPVDLAAMTAFPAIVAGNAVVLKVPEVTPYTPALWANLALEAGLPPGVLNIVVGGVEAGEALVAHTGVDKIAFTGSAATGRRIMAAASATLKPLVLELGGKSANLVFADADLEAAAAFSAMLALVPYSGQGCLLPTRVLVEARVASDFVDRLVDLAESFVVGMPSSPDTQMGPVITEGSMTRILSVIDTAKSAGVGQLVTGGSRLGGDLAAGYFIAPTIFRDVDQSSSLARDEIFGPVLAVSTFDSEEQGVAMANDSEFGLSAYVQTLDLRRAHRVSNALDAGYISVNGFNGLQPGAPFGGNKQSGFGREGGRAGLYEFLRTKNIFISAS